MLLFTFSKDRSMHKGNLFNSVRQLFYRAFAMRHYTVATDKAVAHGSVSIEANTLTVLGRADGARNIVAARNFQCVSGSTRLQELFGETTPVGAYDNAPIGSCFHQLTFASGAPTVYAKFYKRVGGWDQVLFTSSPVVTSVATTALATSAWHGMRVQSKVPTGVTSAGQQTGIYVETEVTGTGVCTGAHYGIKVETYVESTATMSSDHYGIAVFTYSDVAGNQEIYPLRLEHNGASVAGAFVGLYAAANKMRLLISSSTTDDTWMSITTTPTCGTAGGWYKVKHGGYTRYIQLWQAVS